jgi:tRNA-(ms[2]io[6]A)-hydroxylase
MLCLRQPTDPRWVSAALADLDRVLADHAHCEMKAASNALSLAARVADRPDLVRRLLDIAEEEMTHFRQVLDELERRQIPLGPPGVDRYAAELRKIAGTVPSRMRGASGAVVDRLLVAALIEARSCERFQLLAQALATGKSDLGAFYEELLAAEARHFRTFVDLAIDVGGDETEVRARLGVLADAEGRLCAALAAEPNPTIHG